MGATAILEAIEAGKEALMPGMGFEDEVTVVVDAAHSALVPRKGRGADPASWSALSERTPRRLEMHHERGLGQGVIAQLGACTFTHPPVLGRGTLGLRALLGADAGARRRRFRPAPPTP